MKRPLVSIVTPALNARAYLLRCWQSIHSQDLQDWEWLVVDNGSTDGTLGSLAELASSELRIRVLHEPRKGLSEARNCGLDHARGQFLTFLDADDRLGPGALSKRVSAIQNTPGFQAAACACHYEDEDGRLLYFSTWPKPFVSLPDFSTNQFVAHVPIFRSEDAEGLRFSTEHPHEAAYLFWYNLAERGVRFLYLAGCHVVYTQHRGSMSRDVVAQTLDAVDALGAMHTGRDGLVAMPYQRVQVAFEQCKILLRTLIYSLLQDHQDEVRQLMEVIDPRFVPEALIAITPLHTFLSRKLSPCPEDWSAYWVDHVARLSESLRRLFPDPALEVALADFRGKSTTRRRFRLADRHLLRHRFGELVEAHGPLHCYGTGQFLAWVEQEGLLNSPGVAAVYDDDVVGGSSFIGHAVRPSLELADLPRGTPVVLMSETAQHSMAGRLAKFAPHVEPVDLYEEEASWRWDSKSTGAALACR